MFIMSWLICWPVNMAAPFPLFKELLTPRDVLLEIIHCFLGFFFNQHLLQLTFVMQLQSANVMFLTGTCYNKD